ncbi:protein disulfide-isomerase MPD1 precursor [Didymella exigua CBS 183.55]|uniref:protein disulfide-isomerase n=1 Tax=Didymella exigua CBS 183.55 TaxID=1150837 RepID=A0A6A5RYB2_9PLEO|nr:protein disulfide-isomerase MPD1 precursor [Didymella exigua CBS 183.55]KAF1932018.1 protein disulfide-isomerase MPD1 precursor [Didymella exigua CBS 183.55]
MVRLSTYLAATAALALNAHAETMYSKKSGVLNLAGTDYDRVIAKSNYTSIVEFYAPWCGHCKNLKPAYEKAAQSLAGIAKVAAVNCDEEMNKPFCGQMGVQGFPTLKIVRPGKKPGKPTVEDYQGPRSAKGIVDAVKDKVPNIVKRVTDKNLDEWLLENKDSPKAILFSDKGVVSATMRALAIDFAGVISVAQIKKSEKTAIDKYGVTDFPSLILVPAGSEEPIKHAGKVEKEAMVEFLSQVAPPNPDCPGPKAKKPKAKKDSQKESKSSSKFAKASASHKTADASSAAASATDETVEEPIAATESPDPNVKTGDTPEPVELPVGDVKPSVPSIADAAELQSLCLNEQAKTCILAILPPDDATDAAMSAMSVITTLTAIHKKHGTKLFPFITVPPSNPLADKLRSELSLGTDDTLHLVATHGKRAWYKKYPSTKFGAQEVESWVDAIRMGEGKKEKLPESLIAPGTQEPIKEKVAEQEPIQINVEEIIEDSPEHNEL